MIGDRPNRLFFGDNLDVLCKLRDETVDLCYIDPPFNSKRNYNQIYNNIGAEDLAQSQAFVDTWNWNELANDGLRQILDNEGNRFSPQSIELIKGLRAVLREGSLLAYLISITLRAVEVRRVLRPNGSFYFHCDSTSSHYLKLILDGVFCSEGGGFQNEVIWKRNSAHSDTKQGRRQFGRIHDTLFFYTKSDDWTWNPQYTSYDQDYVDSFYKYIEEGTGRRYRLGDLTGPGGAAKGNPRYEVMGVTRYWRYSRARMAELIEQGRVIQTKPGGVPAYKRYLDEMPGVPLQDMWIDVKPIGAQAAERLGYPTQKPETLLERIILASSNEGDVVLDAYCGCGTTIAVAQKLNRRWIGIDITYQSISLVLRRLEKFGKSVVDEVVLDGVPKDMASAVALAHKKDDRVRKEFEKWAVLTYSNNRAMINQRKGADFGIDGTAYFMTSRTDNEKMIFQVKSGNVGERDIRDLRGTMEQSRAALGIFITLQDPTSPMIKTAHAGGSYHHELMGRHYERIQIVSVAEIIERRKRLDIPLSREVLKSVERLSEDVQLELDLRYTPAETKEPLAPTVKKGPLADPKARERRRQERPESQSKKKTG